MNAKKLTVMALTGIFIILNLNAAFAQGQGQGGGRGSKAHRQRPIPPVKENPKGTLHFLKAPMVIR